MAGFKFPADFHVLTDRGWLIGRIATSLGSPLVSLNLANAGDSYVYVG